MRLGQSYHAEVLPAPGTYLGEANLVIEEPRPGEEGDPGSQGAARKGVLRDTHRSRPHLWVSGGGQGTNRGERGKLQVVIHARRDGLIFPLFFSAAVIAGVLALVPTKDGHLDGITLGALLLAPVALAAYYARSDENSYLTMAMRGVRGVATLSVVAGITVIALLGLGYIQPHVADGQPVLASDPTAIEISRWAGRAALVCAIELGLAIVAPTVGEAGRRALGGRLKVDLHPAGASTGALDFVIVALSPLILILIGIGLAMGLFALLPV